ncbi:hypothetical protein C8A01DRAFT_20321 [Parachaetomium inaequale]|uniref:Uncharacterized protein n=1 Tax=Parachaetomium inaequale TaxID=2588326 RepID=A0AAN6P8B8_9PEZI|nr:hypothetical protein C8A01DRAFT_20321 [Parachaetomium inaequale]
MEGATEEEAKSPSSRACGSSAAEAIASGCTWDQLTWSWYPPRCRHYANDEFLAYHDWKFWIDPFRTQEVVGENWTLALDGKKHIWTQRGEHLTHCVFFLLSAGQAARDGTPLSPRLREYEHMHHCAYFLLDVIRRDADWESIDTSNCKVSFEEHC